MKKVKINRDEEMLKFGEFMKLSEEPSITEAHWHYRKYRLGYQNTNSYRLSLIKS